MFLQLRALAGGEVNGVPVALRVTVPIHKDCKLLLGLSVERRVIGRWVPRMPRTMRPEEFWPRVNLAIAALAVAAAAQPHLLFSGWQLAIPPPPIPRSARQRPAARAEGAHSAATGQRRL